MKHQNDIIGEFDVFGLRISKKRLLDNKLVMDGLDNYVNFFDLLEDSKCRGNNVMIEFTGYEDDRRNLYDIPEIMDFFETIFFYKPHFFYFLSNEIKSIELAYLALATNEIDCDIEVLLKMIINFINVYSIYRGDNTEDQVKHQIRISSAITNALVFREIQKAKGV